MANTNEGITWKIVASAFGVIILALVGFGGNKALTDLAEIKTEFKAKCDEDRKTIEGMNLRQMKYEILLTVPYEERMRMLLNLDRLQQKVSKP